MQHHTFGRRDFLTGMGAAALSANLPVAAQTAGEVNVGIILPLSGANAQFGINSRQGIERRPRTPGISGYVVCDNPCHESRPPRPI